MKQSAAPQTVLSMNRAEELGYDVWEHFVIPPFYHKLDLQTARKPRLIIGGRGCGKTMLLRYLSHQSMFSKNRPNVPDDALSHIGLFWRTDTHFANLMHDRGVVADIWESAFSHMAALILGMEVIDSLFSIANSSLRDVQKHEIEALDFSRLKAFDSQLPARADFLRSELEARLWHFESWVSNVRTTNQPTFLPGRNFILALIQEVKMQIDALNDANFFVYVDEYENLREGQREIVNTWLKHSEKPLIFNLAMKRNSFDKLDTNGPEALANIHDFRVHDLEEYMLSEDADVFLAEILFLELAIAGINNSDVNVANLRDESKLAERKNSSYVTQMLTAARSMLPGVSQANLAAEVFKDAALKRKLSASIERALKKRRSSLTVDRFLKPNVAEASIVSPVILNRHNRQPEEVATEIDRLERGENNRFTGHTGWIHNNFIGSLLQLYDPYDRPCPFYAGFKTFRQLSRGNIRHFLELCYKSINRSGAAYAGDPIAPPLQAEAARQASTAFLGEIRSFGPFGNQLHTFVLRLGSLFALAHRRPSLSESEQSHFSAKQGPTLLSDEDLTFLREATKWSVLFEEPETKAKDFLSAISVDYVLNPIYAPYFHISYRKKRKLELTTGDLSCLMRGSYDDVTQLIRKYSRAWSVETSEAPQTLFSHLQE
jgi:hypothetical protein